MEQQPNHQLINHPKPLPSLLQAPLNTHALTNFIFIFLPCVLFGMPLLVEDMLPDGFNSYSGHVLFLRLGPMYSFFEEQYVHVLSWLEFLDYFCEIYLVMPTYSLLILYPLIFASMKLNYKEARMGLYDVGFSSSISRDEREVHLNNMWSPALHALYMKIYLSSNNYLRIISKVFPGSDRRLVFSRLLPVFLL